MVFFPAYTSSNHVSGRKRFLPAVAHQPINNNN